MDNENSKNGEEKDLTKYGIENEGPYGCGPISAREHKLSLKVNFKYP